MSRRKQSNPRQIKRALNNGLEEDEECVSEENEQTKEDFSAEGNLAADIEIENLHSEEMEFSCDKGEEDGIQETGRSDCDWRARKARQPQLEPQDWDGPRELEVVLKEDKREIHSRQPLAVGTTWGPFQGKIETSADGGGPKKCLAPVVVSAGPRWLLDVTWLGAEDNKNNCVVYSKGGQLWCTTTRNIAQGEELVAFAVDFDSQLQAFGHASLTEGTYPARLLDSIRLLPQQAAMASILPTAIVNKDIFPCKACGIWYRSERNLQAHLMYYCSGRQRDPEAAAEERESSPLLVPNICPFPQCKKICSGPQALEMHLSTHSGVKLEETLPPGSSLKCTVCNYAADSLTAFQHHVFSHLSQAAFRCSHCNISFPNHREFLQHQDLHGPGGGKPRRGAGGEQSPRDGDESQRQAGTEQVNKRDVPRSPRSGLNEKTAVGSELEKVEKKPALPALKGDAGAGDKASFSYTRIKSEPSSPRLASSPVQHNMGPMFPMGPFLSQFAFSQDISVAPQASEILAKMSELVHRRLRHGRNNYPPMIYSPLVPKGATCFECNITFNNLDNYLVHKKHYCNSRWQHLAKSPDFSSVSEKVSETAISNSGHSLVNILNTGHLSEAESHLVQSACLNSSVLDLVKASGKVPDKELSGPVKKAPTPSVAEENPNGSQGNLKSPTSSLEDNESDRTKTTCEACKITFSRQETYMVHKQYYCATRHDPPIKRFSSNKLPAMQRTMRTRKRRKMSELALPDEDNNRHPGVPLAGLGMPSLGSSCTSQEVLEGFGEQFYPRCNMFPGMAPKHLEAPLTATKSALASKCNTPNQEEPDAPIDLSKKSSPNLVKACTSPKRLLDYHECTVCKISFNKVENYLAHKQNFCPVTASQHSEVASLDKFLDIKSESNSLDNAYDKSTVKCDESASGKLIAQNGSVLPSHLGPLPGFLAPGEAPLAPVKEESKNLFLPHCFYPRGAKNPSAPDQVPPYYGTKHAEYANGSLAVRGERADRKLSPNGESEVGKDQPAPNGYLHTGTEPISLLPKNRAAVMSLNGELKPEESLQGSVPAQRENPPHPAQRENPPHPSQPADGHPSRTRTSETPADPGESASPSREPLANEVAPGAVKGVNGPGPAAGGGKYCQLCDIHFSSLSSFITHKKFYCSPHTAEHVK